MKHNLALPLGQTGTPILITQWVVAYKICQREDKLQESIGVVWAMAHPITFTFTFTFRSSG